MAKKAKKKVTKKSEKKPRGRPCGYVENYPQMLIDYFSKETAYKEITRNIMTKNGPIEITEKEMNDFPTLAGFCTSIGIYRQLFFEWCRKFPDLSDAHYKIKEIQEDKLVQVGMRGLSAGTFTALVAKNLLSWKDKVESENQNTNVNINLNYKVDDDE